MTRTWASQLRERPTPTEALLWERLRARALGVKFRQQHPIAGFIVDFYAPSAGLVVEVDGDVHDRQAHHDRERDARIMSLGVRRILRIRACDVRDDIERVVALIRDALDE